jgi:hypothetical protein
MTHTEGGNNKNEGEFSHAEGYGNYILPTAVYSHVEGYMNKITSAYSHVGGQYSEATGSFSFAHGYYSISRGNTSTAFGSYVTAEGNFSTAMGYNITTNNEWGNICVGSYNDTKRNTMFEIGIGSDSLGKRNGFEVYKDGNIVAPYLSINDSSDDKTLINKEYFDNFGKIDIVKTLPEPTLEQIKDIIYELDSGSLFICVPKSDSSETNDDCFWREI